MKTENNFFIKFRKCAYIFDALSASNYYAKDEKKRAILSHLRKMYDREELRAEWFKAQAVTVRSWNGAPFEKIQAEIFGEWHDVNALQIEAVRGYEGTAPEVLNINKRIALNLSGIVEAVEGLRPFCRSSFLYDKLKSFELENFTEREGLGYIRMRFNGARVCFAVSEAGELLTANGVGHFAITPAEILKQLAPKSKTAIILLSKVLNYIIQEAKKEYKKIIYINDVEASAEDIAELLKDSANGETVEKLETATAIYYFTNN